MKPDEKWVVIPPTNLGLWQITIRNTAGEYRTPTHIEMYELRAAAEREPALRAGLKGVLELLRYFISCSDDADAVAAATEKLRALQATLGA